MANLWLWLSLLLASVSGHAVLRHALPPVSPPARRSHSPACVANGDDEQPAVQRASKRPPKRLIPFETARAAVVRLCMRNEEEWRQWVADQKPGITSKRFWHMPSRPDEAYGEKWAGWDDWLGVPLPYEEAKAVVATLDVPSQEMWWAVTRQRADLLLRLRVPARPHLFYRDEWLGYDDWLGLESKPLFLPADYGRKS